MNNNKGLITISQEVKFTTIPQVKTNINDLPKLAKQILFLMVGLNQKHDKYNFVFPSRITIAATLGTHVKAISEMTNQLQELGLVQKSRRYNKSNFYFLHPYLITDDGQKLLKKVRIFATFALSFLLVKGSPIDAANRAIPLYKGLYNKEIKFVRATASNSFQSLFLNYHHGAQNEQLSTKGETYNRRDGHPPSTQYMTRDDWDKIYDSPKKEFSTQMFTEEQLLDIAKYPRNILEQATKRLTNEMHSGKEIHNHFGYFKAICDALIQQEKTPKRDGYKTRASVASRPVEEYKPEVRPKEDQSHGYRTVLTAQKNNPTANVFLLDMIRGFRNRVVLEHGEQVAIDIEKEVNP